MQIKFNAIMLFNFSDSVLSLDFTCQSFVFLLVKFNQDFLIGLRVLVGILEQVMQNLLKALSIACHFLLQIGTFENYLASFVVFDK